MASNFGSSNLDDLVQNVVLAGQEAVVDGFKEIADAGKEAFQAIKSAVEGQNLSSFIGGVVGLTDAIAGVISGTVLWAKANSELVAVQARLGDAEAASIDQISGFIGALASAGGNVDNLTQASRRFAFRVGQDWPAVQKEIRHEATQIISDQLAIKRTTEELQASQTTLAITQNELAQKSIAFSFIDKEQAIQRRNAANSVAEAVTNLIEAQARRQAFEETGSTQLDADLQNELTERKLITAEVDAQTALAQKKIDRDKLAQEQALQKERQDLELQHLRQQVVLEQIQQQVLVNQLAREEIKLQEDKANSIEALRKFVEDTAAGIDTSNQKVVLSEQNVIKGLIAAGIQGADGLKPTIESIGEFGLAAPKMFPIMLKLADLFSNLTDVTTKNAVATAIFGRGFSQSLIEVLSLGSAKVLELKKRLDELKITATDASVEIEKDFRRAFGTFALEAGLLSQRVVEEFVPILTEFFKVFTKALEDNIPAIKAWAAATAHDLLPVAVAFFDVFSGGRLDLSSIKLDPDQILSANKWTVTFHNIKNELAEWVDALVKIVTVGIPLAFAIVTDVLERVANAINALFGTKLTGTDVGIGLLIGQLTGLNNFVLGTLAGTFNVVLLAAIVAAFTNPLFAIAALQSAVIALAGVITGLFIGTVLASLIRKFQEVEDNGNTVWENLKIKFSENPFSTLLDNIKLVGAAILAGFSVEALLVVLLGWPAAIAATLAVIAGLIIGFNWDEAWATLKNSVISVNEYIRQQFRDGIDGVLGLLKGIDWSGVWDGLKNAAQSTWDFIKGLFSTKITPNVGADGFPTSPGGSSPQTILHSGGLFSTAAGEGLALLKHLEWVMRPEAVRFYGPAFMNAINNLSFPKFHSGGLVTGLNRMMLQGVPSYHSGGLVNSLAGNISSQGPSTAQRIINLHIDGGPSFKGLTATEEVGRAVENYAATGKVKSTFGRTPRWR